MNKRLLYYYYLKEKKTNNSFDFQHIFITNYECLNTQGIQIDTAYK